MRNAPFLASAALIAILFTVTTLLLSGWSSVLPTGTPEYDRWGGRKSLFEAAHRGALGRHLELTAAKPFAYRMFVPLASAATARVFSPLGAAVEKAAKTGPLAALVWRIEPGRPLLALSAALFMAILSFGFIIAMHRLLGATTELPAPACRGAALLSPLFILAQLRLLQFYDFGTVFFTASAFALLAERRWNLYLALFALSCLNRETTLLLLPVFVLYAWPLLARRRMVALVAIQGVSFLAIRIALEIALANAPEGPIGWSLLLQLEYFWSAGSGVFLTGLAALVPFALVACPSRLIRSGLVVWPVFAALYMIAGAPGEFRVFYECFPVAIVILATVAHRAAESIRARFSPNRSPLETAPPLQIC